VLTMALLKLPQMLHLVMPFAVMLGCMIALWRLSRSHELVAARSAGVSVWQVLAPVLGAAFVLGVVEVTVFNPLAAALHSRFEALEDRFAIRDHGPLSLGEGGLWLRELQADGSSVMVVHARRVRQEASELRLHDLSILYIGADKRFTSRVEANSATLLDGVFRLQDAWDMQPGRPSVHVPTMEIATSLTPQRINDNFASPESISFWQLPEYIAYFEASGFSTHKQRLHFHGLLASPLLLCAMVLVAAAFALQPNLRSGGMLLRFGTGIVAALLFYFFSNVINALGASQTLPLALAVWAPPVVTALSGLALLFHFEDG
jgi:lipopolysaccharide export system permease protein